MGMSFFAWLLMAQMYCVFFFVCVIRWTLWKKTHRGRFVFDFVLELTLAWQNCKRQLRKAFG
jgi:hypothetical protein